MSNRPQEATLSNISRPASYLCHHRVLTTSATAPPERRQSPGRNGQQTSEIAPLNLAASPRSEAEKHEYGRCGVHGRACRDRGSGLSREGRGFESRRSCRKHPCVVPVGDPGADVCDQVTDRAVGAARDRGFRSDRTRACCRVPETGNRAFMSYHASSHPRGRIGIPLFRPRSGAHTVG